MRTHTQPTTQQIDVVLAAILEAQDGSIKTSMIYELGRQAGLTFQVIKQAFIQDKWKAGRGVYCIPSDVTVEALMEALSSPVRKNSSEKNFNATPKPAPAPAAPAAPEPAFALTTRGVASVTSEEVYVPDADPTFVPWGSHTQVKKVIASKLFFPLYISGMSGNGKTMMVEQACAKLKREYVRVQIAPETDEDDLLGGFRLIDGETVFQKGPVVKAMESGAVLLIDEIDRGTNKIMCLQGVLEGKPILLKKIGQMVHPAEGFTVIATANTAGRGSDDGRYSAAQIIDDAFLERFVATIDQPFPELATEKKIVTKHMEALDLQDEQFVDNLVGWSQVIRKTYAAEGVDEIISTRRLCHIVKSFSIFENRLTAIKMCISRFEEETREAFLDLYSKIDSGELNAESEEESANEAPPLSDPPF